MDQNQTWFDEEAHCQRLRQSLIRHQLKASAIRLGSYALALGFLLALSWQLAMVLASYGIR
jgi:hypothetical protein